MQQNIQYKTFKIDCKNATEVKANGKKYGLIKGYVSTFGDIDRGYDVVEKGAFIKCLEWFRTEGKKIPICWQHNLDIPIGGIDVANIYEDSKGLFLAEGKLYIDDIEKAKEIHACIKEGIVTEMSFGYMINDSSIDTIDGENVRKLKDLMLYEISPVVVPMNPKAKITDVKSFEFKELPLADKDTSWDEKSAIERIVDFLGSDEQAFLYDRNFAYTDIIDGKLMAIPKAIFHIASVITKNESNLSYKEANKIKIHLNTYYDKLGIDSPFKGIDIDGTITKQDIFNIINSDNSLEEKRNSFEKMLKKSGMSKSASKIIANKVLQNENSEEKENNINSSFITKELKNLLCDIEKNNAIELIQKNDNILINELRNLKKLIV